MSVMPPRADHEALGTTCRRGRGIVALIKASTGVRNVDRRGQGSREMAPGEGRRRKPLAVTGAAALAAGAVAFLLASPPSSGAAPDSAPGDEPTWPQVISLSPDDAYVDRESGQPLGSSKVAVAAGTVDGSPWSLVTYLAASDPDAEEVAAELIGSAPCVQVFSVSSS